MLCAMSRRLWLYVGGFTAKRDGGFSPRTGREPTCDLKILVCHSILIRRASHPQDDVSWCALWSYPYSERCSLLVPAAAGSTTFFAQIRVHIRRANTRQPRVIWTIAARLRRGHARRPRRSRKRRRNPRFEAPLRSRPPDRGRSRGNDHGERWRRVAGPAEGLGGWRKQTCKYGRIVAAASHSSISPPSSCARSSELAGRARGPIVAHRLARFAFLPQFHASLLAGPDHEWHALRPTHHRAQFFVGCPPGPADRVHEQRAGGAFHQSIRTPLGPGPYDHRPWFRAGCRGLCFRFRFCLCLGLHLRLRLGLGFNVSIGAGLVSAALPCMSCDIHSAFPCLSLVNVLLPRDSR